MPEPPDPPAPPPAGGPPSPGEVSDHLWAVIMAGGAGTRFWPLSRRRRPKQLTRLVGPGTMLQATVARLAPLIPAERVLVITSEAIAEETRRQLPSVPAANIIAEPVGRDTAPCVALSAALLGALDREAVSVVMPADHVISDVAALQECLRVGAATAATGMLVTYGVPPRGPATGYGYIEVGPRLSDGEPAVHRVVRFEEKPPPERARAFVAGGRHLWNSGIFTWRVDAVASELARRQPGIWSALEGVGELAGSPGLEEHLRAVYPSLPKVSVDYALMEHAAQVAVVRATFDWDDIGSWDAVGRHLPVVDGGTRGRGRVVAVDTEGCVAVSEGPLVGLVGVSDVVVAATPDAVLVVRGGCGETVKALVQRLEAEGFDDVL